MEFSNKILVHYEPRLINPRFENFTRTTGSLKLKDMELTHLSNRDKIKYLEAQHRRSVQWGLSTLSVMGIALILITAIACCRRSRARNELKVLLESREQPTITPPHRIRSAPSRPTTKPPPVPPNIPVSSQPQTKVYTEDAKEIKRPRDGPLV